ncbi:cytidylyltransferase domain-containing protein [Humibacter sp. RRB41]|uniref:acylneuraminate cytidylyltransferase family protein n=1 Tax=Humibacter sp. RRB41 TaxID=2919946 RepID=UPI001FA99627|nr:acylneuraminate cytidylyltransferase family protein [Humibacter sp. RRB41]
MSSKILAVIPARGGSKGLPGKNLLPLAGVPLIGYAIACGEALPSVARTIVTTDDRGIANTARALGGDVPFIRPAELAQDDTPMAPVIQHALAEVERQEGVSYDGVLLLDPTSPARDPHHIDQAILQFDARPDLDGVVAVSAPFFDPLWVGIEEAEDGTMRRFFPEAAGVTRRQGNPRRYLRVNGSFYLWRSAFVRRLKSNWLDEGVFAPFEIPEAEAFSIDDESEFRMIEALAAGGFVRLPAVPTEET